MKRRHGIVLLLGLCVAFAAHAIDPLKFDSRAQELRFQHLTRELRCLVCQNESLLDSQAELAQQMRHIIYKQMQDGRSDAQIKQYLVARYSDYVLYDPPLKPTTWLLWFGPGAIVLLGAAGLLFTVRKRARSAPAAPPPVDDEDW
ncbi:cytochrome c-type biogenesis protein [Oleiagrimonas soli]|uniref:Cytochrome c-type biogenesis protein n=1 Tax=Oleiagrimonas soli TaxID=1543381 RepID=A0A099CX38_9GAMM|nr:cytochrome c-type biogenesis protein [Oleiagrimonas soli]KGI77550.1 cytochrome C biogenesis protein [Oleiagrimonas soli]MBB6182973.1 cytochrome c-type biogenesis protein CcmH [Oleiagrimonas soli]